MVSIFKNRLWVLQVLILSCLGFGCDGGGTLEISTEALNFGTVTIGTYKELTTKLKNDTDESVEIVTELNNLLTAPFQVVGGSCLQTKTLKGHTNCDLVVRYTPIQELNSVINASITYLEDTEDQESKEIVKFSVQGNGFLDCTKSAELQTAFANGQGKANTENQANSQAGTAAGNALTHNDGVNDGYATSYDNAYDVAYNNSYNQNYNIGYSNGYIQGKNDFTSCFQGDSAGANKGSADGSADGDYDGYNDGYNNGYNDGYVDYYSSGYYDGSNSCSGDFAKKPVPSSHPQDQNGGITTAADPLDNPAFIDSCFEKGYSANYDTNAFNSAYNKAKVSNQDYQNGYSEGIALGKSDGQIDGSIDGAAKGKNDGTVDGFQVGSDEHYQECYAVAYSDEYEDAYDSSYAFSFLTGDVVGYSAGSDDGYLDGYDQGVFDYCSGQNLVAKHSILQHRYKSFDKSLKWVKTKSGKFVVDVYQASNQSFTKAFDPSLANQIKASVKRVRTENRKKMGIKLRLKQARRSDSFRKIQK